MKGEMAKWLNLLLFSVNLQSIQSYEIAPITSDMTSAAQEIINNLLPSSGVTQTSSVGWSRLAYICGRITSFHLLYFYNSFLSF